MFATELAELSRIGCSAASVCQKWSCRRVDYTICKCWQGNWSHSTRTCKYFSHILGDLL